MPVVCGCITAEIMSSLPPRNQNYKKARNAQIISQVVLCLLCVFVAKGQQPSPSPTPRTGRAYTVADLPKMPPPAGPQGQSPVTFKDATTSMKLGFMHQGSPTSMKYLPETMGGGV